MKKTSKKNSSTEMREEYDFTNGVRGKYAKRYAEGTNVIVLAPDVAAEFKNSHSVNEALRCLVMLRESSASVALEALAKKPAQAAIGLPCQPLRLLKYRRRQRNGNGSCGSHSCVRAGYD